MSGLLGGGNKTQTTTETAGTTYPAWITGAQQNVAGAGAAMANPFLQIPNYGVAGFNPDQAKAFDLTRGVAQTAFTGSPVRGVGAGPTLANTTHAVATNANTTNATAAQVNPAEVMAQMNPFVSTVVAPAMDALRRQKNSSAAEIGARSAAAGSFGGSREVLQRALLDRSSTETASQTVAQLMSQGYDQATATALANAGMRQQTELTNAGAANQTSQFNAGALNDLNRANAAANNATSQFNANLATDFATRAPTIEDGLANNAQTRQLNALQQLLGTGATQQGLAQNALDIPWTTLARYAALVPQVYDNNTTGTTTAPDNSPSGLQQLLGAGVTLGSAYLGRK